MNASARVLVTLATILVLPIGLAAGAVFGAAVAIKFAWLWLDFVWNDIRL